MVSQCTSLHSRDGQLSMLIIYIHGTENFGSVTDRKLCHLLVVQHLFHDLKILHIREVFFCCLFKNQIFLLRNFLKVIQEQIMHDPLQLLQVQQNLDLLDVNAYNSMLLLQICCIYLFTQLYGEIFCQESKFRINEVYSIKCYILQYILQSPTQLTK